MVGFDENDFYTMRFSDNTHTCENAIETRYKWNKRDLNLMRRD